MPKTCAIIPRSLHLGMVRSLVNVQLFGTRVSHHLAQPTADRDVGSAEIRLEETMAGGVDARVDQGTLETQASRSDQQNARQSTSPGAKDRSCHTRSPSLQGRVYLRRK